MCVCVKPTFNLHRCLIRLENISRARLRFCDNREEKWATAPPVVHRAPRPGNRPRTPVLYLRTLVPVETSVVDRMRICSQTLENEGVSIQSVAPV